MWDVLAERKGSVYVTAIPKGTQIPENLILLHEKDDHYSLQCSVPMTPAQVVGKINKFLATCESFPRETYFERNPLPSIRN